MNRTLFCLALALLAFGNFASADKYGPKVSRDIYVLDTGAESWYAKNLAGKQIGAAEMFRLMANAPFKAHYPCQTQGQNDWAAVRSSCAKYAAAAEDLCRSSTKDMISFAFKSEQSDPESWVFDRIEYEMICENVAAPAVAATPTPTPVEKGMSKKDKSKKK